MRTVEPYDEISVLQTHQEIQAHEGTGWLDDGADGVAPSLVDRDDALEVQVTAGQVRVDDSPVSVSAQSKILSDGDPDYPRKDTICVDVNGDLMVTEGTPKPVPQKYGDATGPETPTPFAPIPSDPNCVPIAVIWVPSGAAGYDDLSDPNTTYCRDVRLPVNPVGGTFESDVTVASTATLTAQNIDNDGGAITNVGTVDGIDLEALEQRTPDPSGTTDGHVYTADGAGAAVFEALTQSEITDFASDAATISVQSSAPSSPSTNDIWLDTS